MGQATKAAFEFAHPRSVAVLTQVRQCPTFIGSGAFLELGEHVYLVTASHVLSEIDKGLMVARNGFTKVSGDGVRTSPGEGPDLDVAFIRVDSDLAAEIDAEIIPESKILRSQPIDPFVCFSGYPYSKNKPGEAVRVGSKSFASYCFVYAGDAAEVCYAEFGKSSDIHFGFNYVDGWNEKGNKTKPPSPSGMSGGPLWFANDLSCSNDLFLAGVFIEFHARKGNIGFATRIGPAIDRVFGSYEV